MELGRPGLVHPRFLQLQRAQSPQYGRLPTGIVSVESIGGLAYFYTLTSSSPIIASTVELMYNDNVDAPQARSVPDLVGDYSELIKRLREWRETISHFGGLVSAADLNHAANGSFDTLRLRILLSIHYYRLSLMMAWPVTITFVDMFRENQIDIRPVGCPLWEDFAPVAKDDWLAAKELSGVIHAITTTAEPFVHSNAAWYTCSYTLWSALTVCLHIFVLLLACRQDKNNQLGFSLEETRSALETGLQNLKLLEGTSLMSYKARSCLVKLMEVFDSLLVEMHQCKDMVADRAFSFPINTAGNTSAAALSDMLKTLCIAIPHILPRSTRQHLPLLWHKDLHFGNLFVSPDGKITCIVDWQDTDISTLFLAARIPQFIDVEHDTLLLELPENFSEMPEARRFEVWERYRQSMLKRYYLADLAALLEDEQLAPIRKQVELFARIPFRQDVDALSLRETLLRIQRHWSGFLRDGDVAMQCPIKIEGDELVNHQKDGRRYNEFQDLLKARNISIAEEGWVPVDEFAERKDGLKTVTKETIESLETQRERSRV
ncbi:uncharacterized protein Z518_06447 [Rhinocladiella mackenziei CBS 650.93]|uniref:Altered inheritance of mitochondria protein 9, mitochondrial n=1 Tax=Rhinocladiella mackenziei CBS 650.93 TaxID=1442369 RepID=A0A0D2J8Y5_9EURO|nr:uncharacterized protein Z518_06447 [Rhinocladiella mackenziei CBS 650.93]KIX05575.1 hypothetical protein Z518_06447 [Rhinocladiella mackenziei CBS 650.93]